MQRARMFLITLIILALAVHIVWLAVAPIVPYSIGGLVVIGLVGMLYYRKRRW